MSHASEAPTSTVGQELPQTGGSRTGNMLPFGASFLGLGVVILVRVRRRATS